MAAKASFIQKHGLWTEEQRRAAASIKARIKKDKLKLFRVAWVDPHGASRAKTLTLPALLSALENGHNTNVATTTLDAAASRVFSSFSRGGGMNLEEMTGSPNLVVVPDPFTFRVLPWEPSIGWILGDEYFVSGKPFHFSTRQLLRKSLAELERRGMRCVIGLEVEWYLLRLAQDHLTAENIGSPGVKGQAVATYPVEPGYVLHSESNMDQMQRSISALADTYDKLGLPLRSIENEFGPGQLECTFAPRQALEAADNVVLFRTATRQVCRRMGFMATFMCRPNFKGVYSSGWHLHQSLVDTKSGRNLFMPNAADEILSPLGRDYLGGLMQHAVAAGVFASPTVNGYRRFRANSLAPDRVTWGIDHRGTMLRVLSGPNDAASRIENRMGEPFANPYLYILSQIVSGFDGISSKRDPGPPDTDPYTADRPKLPKSLSEALTFLENEPLFRSELGGVFMDYYLKFKRTEAGRYDAYAQEHEIDPRSDDTTEWEQNEYLDFF
jgi:glutamine synthetase